MNTQVSQPVRGIEASAPELAGIVEVSIPKQLVVRGARTHNLKSVTVTIPHRALVVFTGVSGSGKSSLAFDTIFAEGHRLSLQSVSTYARQFLQQVDKPEVDSIEGLCSAVAIDQESAARNPRSTVGTATDAYDILRVLYSRIGVPHCPVCGKHMARSEDGQTRCVEHPDVGSPEMASKAFSFNLPFGVCPACTGLGVQLDVDARLVVPDPERSLVEGALRPFTLDRWANVHLDVVKALAHQLKASPDVPWKDLPEEIRETLLRGENLAVKMRAEGSNEVFTSTYEGAVHWVRRQHREAGSDAARQRMAEFLREGPCQACDGGRLNPLQLSVTLGGKSIAETTQLTIERCAAFMRGLKLSDADRTVADRLLEELLERLESICGVGLTYLTLDRAMPTLSGGEAQRIRLASLLGTRLFGMMYVLDEPTTGLHPRDGEALVASLMRLRDQGNTVLLVEHDPDVMRAADWIVEVGPGAGQHGGHVTYSGSYAGLLRKQTESLTGAYLRGEKHVPFPRQRRTAKGFLRIHGARARNLQNIDVAIPLGCLIAVTGVSGSGKSTLVNQVLLPGVARHLGTADMQAGEYDGIDGMEAITGIIQIDQSPIGRTPRSNAATYTGAFDGIRSVFARTPEARRRGYKPGRFSSNIPGGRCEECAGDGTLRIPMQFLIDVFVPCSACQGTGFLAETREILYHGRSIADVLAMSVTEALALFHGQPAIETPLRMVAEVGLDYLRLGQPANTLSGGEAQRIKLATELQKKSDGHTLYLLDEPSRGLHLHDLSRLMQILNGLVEKGNTVLVVEHNIDLIRCADWVMDLGPEGGDLGGLLVAEGTPETVMETDGSYTGQYLLAARRGSRE